MATQSKTPRKRATKTASTTTETVKIPVSALADTQAAPAAPAIPKGKLGALINLLRRPEGACIEDLTAATGWQAHSVRGAISGAVKKKLGLPVTSEKTEAGRVYRIGEGAGA